VPAFSSLGWFADPLYSSMIKGRDHDIVELIVHESLHATVWVGNSVDFNEKLANFVGLEGSVRWMEKEKGAAGVAMVREEVRGEKVFADFMHQSVERYKKTVKSLPEKEKFYRELLADYEAFVKGRQKSLKFTPVPAKFANWNNAALMAYGNYYSDMSVFEALLKKCGDNLGRFVTWVKTEKDKGDASFKEDPEAYLKKLVDTASCP
jgi:predicted aminopeptidase